MKYRESGFINFGSMTLIVGGLALAGLLVYGWASGQGLPLWPAVLVILVNIVASIKIILDTKKIKDLAKKPFTENTQNK